MWVPPEDKDPVVLHAPTRKSVACFGAVSLTSGKFVGAMSVKFNAETFETFLKKLLRHRSRGKKMVIVLDNARYHHAKLLAPLLHRHRKHLMLLFLPPYCPQLAPIERVWKLARRLATHNRYFATLDELLIAVDACFNGWQKPNSVLRRLCGVI
jgi:transposase